MGTVIDAHPDALRLLPVLMAGCGIRINEAMGVALEDFDFGERILHVRRQVKKLGVAHAYALPKNGRERDVPLPDWVAAAAKIHITKYTPRPCTLPWEKLTGRPQSHNILFRWGDGNHVRYRTYSEQVWKPAIAQRRPHPRTGHRQARTQAVRHHPQRRTTSVPPLLRQRDARQRSLS